MDDLGPRLAPNRPDWIVATTGLFNKNAGLFPQSLSSYTETVFFCRDGLLGGGFV